MSLGFSQKKRNASAASVNITSLMDILTIIIIFLLVNYSDTVEELDLPAFIQLPTVATEKGRDPASTKRETIIMVVGSNRIDINKSTIQFNSFFEEKQRILDEASSFFQKQVQVDSQDGKSTGLSIQADKDISYDTLDEILLSAAAAGITKVEFLALKGEK